MTLMVPEGEGEKPKPGGVKGKDKKSVQAPTAVNEYKHAHTTSYISPPLPPSLPLSLSCVGY